MAIQHAEPAQVIDIRPLGEDRLRSERSIALFKSNDLEVIRLVMNQGTSMPLHQVPGEITIQCLEGSMEVSGIDWRVSLHPSQLLYLTGGDPHAVLALQDCSALVTIALKTAEGLA